MKYLFELAVAGVLILSVGSASVAQAEVPADRRIYRYCYSHDLKTKTVRYSQVFPADIHKRAETENAFSAFLAAGAIKQPRVDCGDARDRAVAQQRKIESQGGDRNSTIIEIQWVENPG